MSWFLLWLLGRVGDGQVVRRVGRSFEGADLSAIAPAGDFVPATTALYDLGITGTRWRRGYLTSGLTITTAGTIVVGANTLVGAVADKLNAVHLAQASQAIGDLLYADAATTMTRLASVAAGSYLRSGGVGTAPAWSAVTLPNAAVVGDIIYASGANAYANLAGVALGQVLVSGGVGTAPAWSGSPSLSGDLSFTREVNHVVSVTTSTTADTAGGNLTVRAGAGVGNANGGNAVFDAGALAGSGTGGSVSLGGTNAESVSVGRAGKTTTVAGALAVAQGATLTGNVGVGAAAEASAALTVTSTTQGLLFPRMTEVQRDAIAAPAAGLVIYNTTTNKLNLRVAAAWEVITSA